MQLNPNRSEDTEQNVSDLNSPTNSLANSVENPYDIQEIKQDQSQEQLLKEERREQARLNALIPTIERMELSIWRRDQIIKESIGEVTVGIQKMNTLSSKELDNRRGSIFYNGIFGSSKDSISSANSNLKFKVEERKRKRNWGYIKLPVPIVIPDTINKRIIQRILNTGKRGDDILKAANWDAYIARPLGINNPNLSDEEFLELMNTVQRFKNTYSSITSESSTQEFQDLVKKGLIVEIDLQNARSCQVTVNDKKKNIYESFFVVSKDLFTKSANSKSIFANRSYWEKTFQLLPGSYGIFDLLQYVTDNMEREIAYTLQSIKSVQRQKINFLAESGAGEIKTALSKKGRDKLIIFDKVIKRLALRKDYLIGLQKQGAKPTDYVTDVIPVLPPHWRDPLKINSGGQEKITVDAINTFYNNLLFNAGDVRKNVTSSVFDFDKLYTFDTLSKTEQQSIMKALREWKVPDKVWSKMKTIQLSLGHYLTNNAESDKKSKSHKSLLRRTSGKMENNRQLVLGKRLDETGRSVITVDQTLALDEIGIPYDILKVHFKQQIIRETESHWKNITNIDQLIDHLGDRYDNPIKDTDTTPGFDVVYDQINSSQNEKIIYDALSKILKTKRYLAIRYPSLHKWNGLGYKIKIVYDQTIHLNPLVCAGYNADFDGDQMSLFALTLPESIKEVDEILSPIMNDMNANGRPMLQPGQDMIMGLYILTLKPDKEEFDKLPIKASFTSVKELQNAIELGIIDLHDKVSVLMPHYKNSNFNHNYYYDRIGVDTYRKDLTSINVSGRDNETLDSFGGVLVFDEYQSKLPESIKSAKRAVVSTAGRFIFNEIIPQDLKFRKRNQGEEMQDIYDISNFLLCWDPEDHALVGKAIEKILINADIKYNKHVCAYIKDKLKTYGYHYVSESGISISINDIQTVPGRDEAVERGYKIIEENKKKYIGKELREKNIETWEKIDDEMSEKCFKELDDENPIKMMAVSGARGKQDQVKQMILWRGIMMDASNKKMETPILRNFNDGLDPIAYTTSSYGSIKGIVDRSRNTAQTGDTARHLIYAMYDVFVTDGDCGDQEGILIKDYTYQKSAEEMTPEQVEKALKEIEKISDPMVAHIKKRQLEKYRSKGYEVVNLSEDIIGRNLVEDIINPKTKEVIFSKSLPVYPTYYGDDFDERLTLLDYYYGEQGVRVRSVFTCKCPTGKCARCSGYFFAKHSHSKVGDATGFTTAQDLSEPATQLIMRTFHTGGIAKGDISGGFGKIKNTFIHGKDISPDITNRLLPAALVGTKEAVQESYEEFMKLRSLLNDPSIRKSTLSETVNGLTYDGLTLASFGFIHYDTCIELFNAVKHEVRDPYLQSNIYISGAHFDLAAMQLLSNMHVIYSGDSVYQAGDTIKSNALISENIRLAYEGKRPIIAAPVLTGCKQLAVDIDNPLSSVFFQRPGEILPKMATMNAEDKMTSPMVAIGLGNSLPLGEGYKYYKEIVRKRLNRPVQLLSDYIKDEATLNDLANIDNYASLENPFPSSESTSSASVQPFNTTGETQQPPTAETEEVQEFTEPNQQQDTSTIMQEEDDDVIGWEEEVPVHVEEHKPSDDKDHGEVQGF